MVTIQRQAMSSVVGGALAPIEASIGAKAPPTMARTEISLNSYK